MKKVGIILGSSRKNSNSELIANNLLQLSTNLELEIIDISNLELYSQDLDEKSPNSYQLFRNKVNEKEAIIFITPEHNRSIPAVLKNALDIGSRPKGESVWEHKTALIIAHSLGQLGGSLAARHLREILAFFDMKLIQQPEIYLSNFSGIIENGEIKKDTRDFLLSALNKIEKMN